MHILITGGAGYIGSHTVVEFLNAGYNVHVVDNLSNSSVEAIKRVEKLSNKNINFHYGDIKDKSFLRNIFSRVQYDCVVHFAGLKAVGESVEKPLKYYDNNVLGTINLLNVMQEFNVKKIIFSSSATVYGNSANIPFKEEEPTGKPVNPYGQTKLIIENILSDIANSDNEWTVALLRYFNPVGAHKSGEIGEDPKGIPNNLVPYILKVASGKLEKLYVFGDDYPTKDGTGVRDYIHVVDLAIGHLKAYEYISKRRGLYIWNLGTGIGYSVLDIVNKFSQITSKPVPYEIAPRREGDIAESWSCPEKAKKELGWQAVYDLGDMVSDSWNWQQKNPDGYAK